MRSVIIGPKKGTLYFSTTKRHKDQIGELARQLIALGFTLLATSGTAKCLEQEGIPVQRVKKIAEGHPNLIDHLKNEEVALIINTPSGKGARTDEGRIRAAAVQHGVPCITTIQAAVAAIKAMEALREEEMGVESLEERFAEMNPVATKCFVKP
jgi:carbamoyl-phosphate synthase large subunit